MAALTWRNVDAPDFRPAMEGFRQFSELLTGSLDRGTAAIKDFDNQKTEQTSAAAILDLATNYQDPAKLEADLASGAFAAKYDPRRLNGAAIDAILSRPSQLLQQASTKLDIQDKTGDIADEGLKREREYAQWGATDKSRGIYAAIAAAGGDETKQAAIKATPEYQATLSQLTPAEIIALNGFGDSVIKGKIDLEGAKLDNTGKSLSNDQARLNIKTGNWEFENKVVDREEQRAAMTISGEILANSVGNPDIAASLYGELTKGLSGPAKAIIRAQLASEFSDSPIFGSLNTGDAGGISAPTGGANPSAERIMNYEARNAGFGSVPSSVKTLGQASEFAKKVNRAGVASSGMGVYQIVGETMRTVAPRVLGANWKNEPFNLENQDKIAEAIFKANRGSATALKGQWVSLSVSEAERVRKMPWSQAREIIASKESGSSPSALELVANGRSQPLESQTRQKEDNVGVIPRSKVIAALTSEATTLDAAEALKSQPRFKNIPRKFIEDQIKSIMTRGTVGKTNKINASDAAAIIEQSLTSSTKTIYEEGLGAGVSRLITRATGGTASPRLGGGYKIDDKLVDSYIKKFKDGDVTRSINNADDRSARLSQKAALEAAAVKAEAELKAVIRRGSSVSPAVVQGYVLKSQQANRAVQLIQDQINSLDSSARAPRPAKPVQATRRPVTKKNLSGGFTPAPQSRVQAYLNAKI